AGLRETPTGVVARVDRGAGPLPAGVAEEVCDRLCVNFVDSGVFGLAAGRRFWRLRRGDAVAWHPEAVQRYVHFAGLPADACVSIRFRDGAAREIDRQGWLADVGRVPVLRPSNRLGFLRLQLDPNLQSRYILALDDWTV